MQLVASTLKVPALFFLTLLVTFPSLYVFNALVGSRLGFISVLRLLIASLGVNLAVLASLGPIVAFFSISTTSYAFMVLLNVLMFTVAGVLGLNFLLQTLHRLTVALDLEAKAQRRAAALPTETPTPEPTEPSDSSEPSTADVPIEIEEVGALEPLPTYKLTAQIRAVFRCWVVLFSVVGAQMGWVLRPFVGSPNQEFAWFRPRGSNFWQAVWQTLLSLFY